MLTDPQEDYARGFVPFLDTTIFLDSRPLIPRTETEYWVGEVLNEIPKDTEVHILDLFSGSGCIGAAILKHRPNTTVTFAEKQAHHFPTVQKTLKENGIDSQRAYFIETDVWKNVGGVFGYIFANPPYIASERASVKESVVAHEPEEALFAPDDGFFFIEKTIAELPAHLTQNGACWIEHEPFQAERITVCANQHNLEANNFMDQYEVLRYSKLMRSSVA